MKRPAYLWLPTLLLVGSVFVGAAPPGSSAPADKTDKDCTVKDVTCCRCHTCETPTAMNKCLKPCPSLSMTHVVTEHRPSEGPDQMLIGALADMYGPVEFDHEAHAAMAEMGMMKCGTCHHYSPAGRIPPCRECHGGEANPNNLRQPGLKGAYHRHCLSCHREWSHDTKCVVCHLPADGSMLATPGDTTDILGISHPVITEPEKRVYRTPYEQGPVVTFHHEQHVQLYGLRCANCHENESCSRCHDLQQPKPRTDLATDLKRMEEVHAICNNCHGDDPCAKCHDTKEKSPFSHDLTGWGLNRFHQRLDCRACHPTGRMISKLDRRCSSCHSGWNTENFKHVVTGFRLDETHAAIECAMCHDPDDFAKTPVCTECHDDGRTARAQPPGEYVR
jgi:hypothetical protein